MKITKRQLSRIIREAMPKGGVPDVMGAMGGGKFQPRIDIDALTDEIGDRAAGGYEPSIDGSPSAYADMIIDSYLSSPPPPLDTMEGLEYVLTNHRDAVEEKILEYIGMMTEGETKMKITKNQLRRIIKEELEALSLEDQGRDLAYGEGEGRMSKSQLFKISEYGAELHQMLNDGDDLPEWVQSKIAVMAHDIGKIKHYLEYKLLRKGEDV